jgi:diguanylate cyclase (GGDEF)-like protein
VIALWAVPALASGIATPVGSSPAAPVPNLAGLPSPNLPVTPPVPIPSLPPVPTPSLPINAPPTPPVPTPSVPPIGLLPTSSPTPPSPTPAPGTNPGAGKTTSTGGQGLGSGNTGSGTEPPHGITIPFTSLVVTSPLDAALLVAVAVLPLLFGIWLLVFGRAWNEARRARDAGIRMALANDLGLSPRELASLSTKGLFKLREQAAFDDLTGVLRRAAGVAAAEHEIVRARRHKSPLTVAFLDLDGLKQINDGRGHAAGDKLLQGLVSGLKRGLRGQDLVLRYGGDEFVCVLPDTVGAGGREKLRQIQAELAPAGIGFSFGIAQLERSDDVVSVLARADSELYEAKSRRGEVRPLRPLPRPGDEDRKRVTA